MDSFIPFNGNPWRAEYYVHEVGHRRVLAGASSREKPSTTFSNRSMRDRKLHGRCLPSSLCSLGEEGYQLNVVNMVFTPRELGWVHLKTLTKRRDLGFCILA